MNIENSKLFTKWINPENKISSYIMTQKAAPVQENFYFTNPEMTLDGRYLWFCCAFPPAGDAKYGRTFAVIDFKNDSVTHFPETQFLDGSPMVDHSTGEVYWCNYYGIYKRTPNPADQPVCIGLLPPEIASQGIVQHISAHLAFNADHTQLCFDAHVGNHFFIGSVEISNGTFTVWQVFDRCYNHAQFSPTDKDLMLICQDSYTEVETGVNHYIDYDEDGAIKRLWLIRRGEKAEYIKMRAKNGCHEGFTADGKYIYYVDWDNGMTLIDIKTRECRLINICITWHGSLTKDLKYQVGDNFPLKEGFYRGIRSDVVFYNSETGESRKIVSHMPSLFTREKPSVYHNDPHPHFICNDRYIIYTTTVRGEIDIAITRVEDLLQ